MLPLYLLPSTVRISATQGDWRSVTEGFQLTGQPIALGGGRRTVVHFHDLDARSGDVHLHIEARHRDVPVRLTVWSGEDEYLRAVIKNTVPTLVTVPVPRDSQEIEIKMEAIPERASAGAVILLKQIEFSRNSDATSNLLKMLCIAAAMVSLLVVKKILGLRAALGVLLTSSLLSSATVVLFDPAAAFAFAPSTRDGFRLIALAILWVFAWTGRRARLSILAAVVGTVGLLYLPSIYFGFLTDDFLFGRSLTWRQLFSTLYGSWDPHGLANDHYRPVVAWSLAWDFWLWGDNPAGYHLTNILIHVLNGTVAYVLLRRLRLSEETALIGTLLWCAHPLSAASVSWANERTDGIMAAAYLVSLVLLTAPDFTRRHAVGTLAFGALSLGSKEMAVTLPMMGFFIVYGIGFEKAKLRYAAVVGLASAVILYLVFWLSLFPEKSKLATDLAFQIPDAESVTTHTLVGLYPAVFLPSIYGWWNTIQQAGPPLWYLLGGLAVWPFAWGLLRYLDGTSEEERAVRLGGIWPLITVAPILGLKGGIDLFRLGLLLTVGFGLTFGPLVGMIGRRVSGLACCLIFISAIGLGYAALGSSEAWGPGGWMMDLGTKWKLASQAWQDQISPEMRHLFLDQVERAGHAKRWISSVERP